jgi:Na+/melibiose symporter-like transporter
MGHDVWASSHRSPEVLVIRLLIRIGVALLGAAIGFVVAAAVLDDMTLDGAAFLIAVGIFVVLTAVLEPFIEKIGDEHLSLISTFSSLITTFLALLITELVSDGLNITGSVTWVLATLIVWASTALATLILVRMFVKNVRDNR